MTDLPLSPRCSPSAARGTHTCLFTNEPRQTLENTACREGLRGVDQDSTHANHVGVMFAPKSTRCRAVSVPLAITALEFTSRLCVHTYASARCPAERTPQTHRGPPTILCELGPCSNSRPSACARVRNGTLRRARASLTATSSSTRSGICMPRPSFEFNADAKCL